MKFSSIAPITLFVSGSVSTVFGQNGTAIVSDLQAVTQLSASLNVTTSNTTPVNAITQGPAIADGLQDIVATVTTALADVSTSSSSKFRVRAQEKPITGQLCVDVVNTLIDFVHVHQALLATISGKYGILAAIGFVEPVRVALVDIEQVVDEFVLGIINLITCDQDEANQGKNQLDQSLQDAINTYSQ